MLWATFWALVLGFTLAGAVQAFVSRRGDAAAARSQRPARDRARERAGRGFVLVLLRGVGDGEDALPARRRLRQLDGLHVRVDEPRGRARDRDLGAARLGVRAGGVRRRRDHDRPLHAPCPARAEARGDRRGARAARRRRSRGRCDSAPAVARAADVAGGLGRRGELRVRRREDGAEGDRGRLPRSPASSPSSSRSASGTRCS